MRVAAGFFDEGDEQCLAMKDIDGRSKERYTEARLAQKVSSQETTYNGIVVPLAIVKTKAEVYIFMPLADCNLNTLMMGQSRRRKVRESGGQAEEPAEKDRQKEE